MIRCIGFDVEILPNFFSITFVSINDYLKVFADVNDNGKPIPLVQKLTVKEIKDRLDKVEKWSFYITDKDDSQLFPMVDFINKTAPRREDDGSITRTDLYGFNNFSYDNLMIAALLSYYVQADSSKELIIRLYETSKAIIKSQDDFEAFKNDFYLTTLKQFKLPYTGIDVMRIFALNKAGVIVDSKTGERKSVPKSLKQTSINLQWYELLEYELPDITDLDIHLYHKHDQYKGMSPEQVNKLVDKWDRYILDDWIPDMMHYNLNDVYIVCEIVRLNPDEIKSRYAVSKTYEVNVLNSSRSKTADTLFEKFYSKFSGLAPEQWKGKTTERTAMSFKKVIFPFIEFKTPELRALLTELYNTTIYRTSKDAFNKQVTIGKVTYNLATGGLHSQDRPMEIWSTTEFAPYTPSTGSRDSRKFTIYHYDVASYYPSIMADHSVYPAHMDKGAFVGLIKWMRDTRVTVKHSNEAVIDGIPKDVLALVLKIVINSIYGKFGFEKGSLYDRLAVLRVTVNGQLMLLMLCEALELEGISIVSANTDGIMVKVYEDQEDKFNEISDWWRNKTKMKADSDIVHCLIARDVNNYVAQFRTKDKKTGANKLKLEYKGALNPFMYAIDLQKGYDMPIVAQAVSDYFLKKIPIMDTLQNATNILDFCKTQNVGRQFHVEETKVVNGKITHIVCQRYVRFYVSNNGVIIEKVHNDSGARSRLAAGSVVTVLNTLDDKDIALRDINFRYYYQECIKIIDPIKLGITPKGTGKTKIKKASGMYNSLFDEEETD